jgi:hypothetical protein
VVKTVSVVVAVSIWGFALWNIFDRNTPFSNQAPKCIFSTMIIFGILIGIFKFIEKLEEEENNRVDKI